MASIAYRSVYQVDVHATDLQSGQPLLNTFYLRCGVQTSAPPAFGFPVVGPSSTGQLLTQFRGLFGGQILTLMSTNYAVREYNMRLIVGKRYGAPFQAITSITGGANPVISTGSPHGLVFGGPVFVSDVTNPAEVNGFHMAEVLTPTSVRLNGITATLPWTNDGRVQPATGQLQFDYGETDTLVNTDAGLVGGDALPLFATASCRRLNLGTGRHFRSRFSLSPFAETQALSGGWEATFRTALQTGLTNFTAAMPNGGSDPGSGNSFHVAVSKSIAMGLQTPFVQSDTWAKTVTGMVLQRNHGSLVSRKPSLTAGLVP